MTPQEQAHIEAAIRGALAEVAMGVCTDESGGGRYSGFCASEVQAARKAWLARQDVTLLARFYALATEAEGADGPRRALAMIQEETAKVLAQIPGPITYPEWFEGPFPGKP